MKTYVFPAILTPDDGGYSVSFPDVPGAFTCGDNLADAISMAEDALSLMLVKMEDDGEKIAKPTDMQIISTADVDIVTLIRADTAEYRKKISKKAVKKTLTIPQWMNEAAEKQGINFSQVLQEAIQAKLQST